MYGGIDIKDGQKGTMYSVNLDANAQEWVKLEIGGDLPGTLSYYIIK